MKVGAMIHKTAVQKFTKVPTTVQVTASLIRCQFCNLMTYWVLANYSEKYITFYTNISSYQNTWYFHLSL